MRIITQRELCDDNAAVMRDVLAGESFLVTKLGRPVARVVPAGVVELPVAKAGHQVRWVRSTHQGASRGHHDARGA